MKSLKNLLIPFIIFIVLLLIVVIWAIAKPKDKKDDQEEEVSEYQIAFVSLNDLRTLQVTGPDITDNRIDIVPDEMSDIGFTFNYASPDRDDAVNYSQDAMRSYASVLTNFAGTSKIESPSDLSEYGLDSGFYTVTWIKNDGSTVNIRVGVQTYDNSGCYCMVEGESDVYVTGTLKAVYCKYQMINFLEKSLLRIDYSQINTVEFDRLSDNVHIVTDCNIDPESGDPYYNVYEPYEIKASSYFENLVEYIATLDISEFLDISEEELAEYGMDEPNYTFIFTMDTGEVIKVELSSLRNGFYYGHCSGIDHYFMIAENQITGLETPILTLLNKYVAYYGSSDLSKISADYEGQHFDLVLDVANGDSISDPDSTAQLNLRDARITTSDGRSYAAIIFEAVACIEIGGIDTEVDPEYDPVLTLTFNTKDYETKTVDFIERDVNSYYVFINGNYSSFYVYANELFFDAGTDMYSYGAWASFVLASEAIDNQVNGVYDVTEDAA